MHLGGLFISISGGMNHRKRLLTLTAVVFFFYLVLLSLRNRKEAVIINVKAADIRGKIKSNVERLERSVQSLKQKLPKAKKQIGIVTVFGEFGSLARDNFEAYAARHHYKFFIGDDLKFEEQTLVMDGHGIKFQVLQRVMQENADLEWFFWCSADSLILNQPIRLERLVDDRFHFILPLSPLGDLKDLAQTDHFFVRNTPQGREIIDDLVRMATRNCGHFLIEYPASSFAIDGWLHVCENDGSFWSGDVGMLLALYIYREGEYRCRFKRIGERMFSARYPRYGPGDFVLGFREEKNLNSRRALLKGALKYADVERGMIDRKRTESLEPSVDAGVGDWNKLEEMYAHLNIPCGVSSDSYNSEVPHLTLNNQ